MADPNSPTPAWHLREDRTLAVPRGHRSSVTQDTAASQAPPEGGPQSTLVAAITRSVASLPRAMQGLKPDHGLGPPPPAPPDEGAEPAHAPGLLRAWGRAGSLRDRQRPAPRRSAGWTDSLQHVLQRQKDF